MILTIITAVWLSFAHALTFDFDAFFFTDDFTHAEETSSSRTIWDAAFTINFDKKGRFVGGWNYASRSFSDENTAGTTELAISEMGPRIGYYLDKEYVWSLFFVYNFQTVGEYQGVGETELRGTSMKAELAFTPPLGEMTRFGLKLNYYSPSWSEEITGETTLAAVSYSRAVIYPSVAFIFRTQ